MKLALAFVCILVACTSVFADDAPTPKPDAKAKAEPPMEMESYQLVLLRRGPAWTPEVTDETKALQDKHLAHLGRMWEEGHLLLAGPFGDQEDETVRGACIYKVASLDEARRLASEDPAVKAGRLKIEAMTWWVGKGYVAFPKSPPPPKPTPGSAPAH